MAPEIIISVPDDGETLVLVQDSTLVYVIADDLDNDPLICEWYIETYAKVSAGDATINDGRYGCTFSVIRDAGYNGLDLRVAIFDPSNDFDERSWPLEVPSEVQ